MKTHLLAVFALVSLYAQGQIVRPGSDAESLIGPHHRRVETVTTLVDENGKTIIETNSIIQLQAGLNIWSEAEQKWIPASDEIELLNRGANGAIARKAQYQVIFPVSLAATNSGIIVQMPDGKEMHTRVTGLAIMDSRNPARSLMLAEVQNSVGTVVGRNQIVYESALGRLGDIRYTVGLDSFEQDVVLREKFVPEDMGFDSATARIEIWTEIVEADAPTLSTRGRKQEVDFGSMRLGFGKAFKLSPDGQAVKEEASEVEREWTTVDGRTFIIETVPFEKLKPFLDVLPADRVAKKLDREQVDEAFARISGTERRRPVLLTALSPVPSPIAATESQVASVERGDLKTRPGVAIDYTLLNAGGQTNYVFKGDETYYVSGAVNLYENVTLEAGTVIKLTNNASLYIWHGTWPGQVYCQTTPFRPAIITSKDDNSVGQAIPGSTGDPNGRYYGNPALGMFSYAASLKHLRILYAQRGVVIDSDGYEFDLHHLQFVKCQEAVRGTWTSLRFYNILMNNIAGTCFAGQAIDVAAEHLTVDQCDRLVYDELFQPGYSAAKLTNSLLVAVTNFGNVTLTTNQVYTPTNGSAVFQTVGAGYHYLANDTYRNIGTTNINSGLAADLKRMTTYPPIVLTNGFTASTNLFPQAKRDDDGQYDLGYHYDPLDWCWSGLTLSSSQTLTLTNGVAVGIYGIQGVALQNASKVISEGTAPFKFNRLVRYNTVQEQPVIWGTNGAITMFTYSGSITTGPEVRLRFTDISLLADLAAKRRLLYNGGTPTTLSLQDSWLRGGYVYIYPSSSSIPINFALTNSLVQRTYLELWAAYVDGTPFDLDFYSYNNLFQGGTLNLNYAYTYGIWAIKDNLFDAVSMQISQYDENNIPASNNGYKSTSSLGGTGNKTVTVSDYKKGPLGDFYYPTSGTTNLFLLVNAGSRNATNAGLYHYVTQTNLVTETNSTVDIGQHYLAVLPTEGLVGHWKLDEAGGTLAPDSSDYGHHGTLTNGPTWTTGTLGGALNFAGSDQYVSVPDSPHLSFASGDFTMSVWVSTTSGGSVLAKGGGGSPSDTEYILHVNGQGYWLRGAWHTSSALSVPQNGNWTHVAVVFTAFNGTLQFYQGGSLVSSTTATGSYASDTSQPFFLGTQGTGLYNDLFGSTDDVRIYNRALSAEEIYSLYSKAYDQDGDGTPDYLEDRNGNGVVDTGERSYTDAAPSVTITNPPNSQVFAVSPTNITINVSALDNGSVTNVEFYSGSTLLGNDTTSSYSLVWSNVTANTYTLTAKAFDNLGQTRISNPLTIIVNAMPSVSLTNPANGAYFITSPTNVTLTATASDSDGSITNVAFYSGSTTLGSDAASPYSLVWSNVNGGNYALTARATDNRGAVSTSSVANITVNSGLNFGTNNAYVTFGSNTNLQLRTFTLECWFKRTATGVATNTGTGGIYAVPLVTKGRAENETGKTNMNYLLGIGTNNVLVADFEDYPNGTNHPIPGVTTISNGVWYHAAVGYNGTNLQLYLNGNLEGTLAVPYLPEHDSIQHAALATTLTSAGIPAGYFYGVMDEVRIWSYGRSQQQIREDMSAVILTNDCGLVARWGLDEAQGSSITNTATTNVINGTITGSGWNWTNSAPYNAAGAALFVVGSTSLSPGDSAISNHLKSLGYFLTIKAATNAVSSDANSKSLVLISSSVTATNVNTKFTSGATPVITWRHDLYDDLGMVTSSAYYGTNSGQTQLIVVNPAHPLAGGFSSTVTVASNSSTFAWGAPNNNAFKIATTAGNPTNYVIFGYEKGMTMPGLVAPARRVGLFLSDASSMTNLNANGFALFDAALDWAITPPCPPVLEVMFVLDYSASMLSNSPYGGTLLSVEKNYATYIATNLNLSLDRAGVVAFVGTNASIMLKQELTNNISKITSAINSLTNPGPFTRIDLGLNTAQAQFTTNHIVGAQPVVMLFTDGVPLSSTTNATYAAAGLAKQLGARLISIGLGTNVNTVLMQDMASSTCDYFLEPQSVALAAILTSITNAPCRLTTNQQPNVSLNSPTNNQLFVASLTNILFLATASDPDIGGSITNVEFFSGSTSLGVGTFNVSSNLYDFVWDNVGPGTYSLSARATDNLGATAFSATVTVTVNALPTIAITTPTNNATFTEVTNITITATASDPDVGGSITNVQFFHGTTNIGQDTSSPFSMVWSNRTAARYAITAKATDNRGGVRESSIIAFTVKSTNLFPTVSITYPTNGATFRAGVDLTITATASDPNTNGSVANVEFFVDGQLLGNDPTSPYSITKHCWKAGNYVLTAKATDNLGAKASSAPVNITVTEELPTAGNGFWDPVFGNPGVGASPTIFALAVSGSTLYAGGNFTGIDNTNAKAIARWDGTNWSPMGDGFYTTMGFYPVRAIAVAGTNIYAGGDFTSDGSDDRNPLPHIAKWGGTNWQDIGGGVNDRVRSIAVIGSDVYVGGDFTEAGGDTNIQYVAKWNGANWAAVGNNTLNGPVYAIAAISNVVYIGGDFTNASGNANADFIARLNGNTWTNLGTGVSRDDGTNGIVRALAVCGGDLFVGGDFFAAGGNTNANGIAKWNQTGWSALGRGVKGGIEDGESLVAPGVHTIALQGNHVFVGGEFSNVFDGTNIVTALYVARATWSEVLQSWTWTHLDKGIEWDEPGFDHVFASAVMESSTNNAYDLFVGGCFVTAGANKKTSQNIGRWSVGRPYPPTAPIVTITNPTNNMVFVDPVSITNIATVTGSNSISQVEFFVDGTSIGLGSGSNPYTAVWTSPINGAHLITAAATDANALVGVSDPVVFKVRSTNNAVTAVDDLLTVMINTPATNLNVLLNDTDTNSSTLRISKAVQVQNDWGKVAVSHDGTYLIYTPFPNTYGTDIFTYTVTNASGASDSASVTVKLRSPPDVAITVPDDGLRTPAPASSFPVNGTTFDWDGTVSNVKLYVNGTQYGSQITPTGNGTFNFTWSQSTPGFYTFTVVATDNHGFTNTSAPATIAVFNTVPSPNLPNAAISNLLETVSLSQGVESVTYPVIRDGLFNLIGDASDADPGDALAYQVLLYRPDDPFEAFANITPGALNAQGFRSGGDTNGDLGTLNFTSIPNGVYNLELNVRGGTDETNASVRVLLETQLKVGQFSFSEQDLVIPVNGIPLTVMRTYNSLNLTEGDFGFSWTMDLNDMDVVIDEDREPKEMFTDFDGSDTDSTPLMASVRVGGGRNVTLTLPNGQRTTFNFVPDRRGLLVYAEWATPPGVQATLVMQGVNTISMFANGFGNVGWMNDDPKIPYENFDVPAYILTTKPDQTQYEITREPAGSSAPLYAYDRDGSGLYDYARPRSGRPRLTRIVQRTQDTIVIGTNGVSHYNPTGALTRTIWFKRDDKNRIKEIRDPIEGENGKPAVNYVYNADTGNLIEVHKLVNRATGSYLTNKYHYDHPRFPHYITAVEDARGIPLARNLYDDFGRLIGIIDAAGRTNRFEHDTTNRIETVYNRKGIPTTYTYDQRGNVTNSINVLGHTNTFVYDANNFLTNHTDPLGNKTTYVNDTFGNVLSVTLPFPAGSNAVNYTTSFTYDSFGNQTGTTLPTGAVLTNQFDSVGNLTNLMAGSTLITKLTYDGNNLVTAEADRFSTNKFGYDSAGNATKLTNTLNQVITSGYDANNQITNLIETNILGAAVTSTFKYDAQGRDTAADYGSGITLSNSYQSQLDWNSVDGPTIGHMERRFDEQGRLNGWTTANAATPGFAYDENGQLLHETNSIGVVTHYTYDNIGRVIAVTNLALNVGTTYGYDAAGRRIAETNALGQVTRFGYNPDGSLAAMTNALGTNVWTYAYDTGAGCCGAGSTGVTITDPLSRQVVENRSEFGLPIQTVFISAANKRTNSITYVSGMVSPDQEAEEYPATITDEGGRVRTFTYTDIGQLKTATDLGGNIWTNLYDATYGSLTALVSPTKETNSFTYDGLDNLKTIKFSDGFSLTNNYNASDNRLGSVNLPSGATVNFVYDSAGRMTNRNSSVDGTALFYYNANDSLTGMSNSFGITTNVFDGAGRLIGMDYPSGANVRYGLDALNRITAITNKASSGGTNYIMRYQYDAVGNVTNVTDPWNGNTSLEYDRVGRRTKRTLPNGVTTDWQYDWRDRVTNIVHKTSGGTTLASAAYERAAGGEPTKITREDGSWVLLAYDNALRLTNEVYYTNAAAQTTNSYGYDAAGNRIRSGTSAGNFGYIIEAGYRMRYVTNSAGSKIETNNFDNGGRLTSIIKSNATLSLAYNTSDQVTNVTIGTTTNIYAHDAAGRRVKATQNGGSERRFLVASTPGSDLESPQLIADNGNALKHGYVFVGDDPLLRFDSTNGNGRVYYLEDGMGSVIGLTPQTSPTTNNTTRLFYDGFGRTRATNGPAPTIPTGTGGDFRFHGLWLEDGTGLYYARARDYDPRTGRFLSRDPLQGSIRVPETVHPYNYASDNPCIYSDPSGQFTIIEINISTAIESGLQGFRTASMQYVKKKAKDFVYNLAKNAFIQQVRQLLPVDDLLATFNQGINLNRAVRDLLCNALAVPDDLYVEVPVNTDGTPQSAGFTCNRAVSDTEILALAKLGVPRPDFIFGSRPPKSEKGGFPKTWLIGEIKATTKTLYADYISPGSNPAQFFAILNYAKKHTYTRTALFVTGVKGDKPPPDAMVIGEIGKSALRLGVIPVVVRIVD